MEVNIYNNDLPSGLVFGDILAIDTETMGLNLKRDRLCVLQLSDGSGKVYLIKFDGKDYSSPNLKALLSDVSKLKLFHFARFDIGAIYQNLGILLENIYCTKIASKLARTYTDAHGLKDLCREILGIQLSKQQQSSDWGIDQLSKEQKEYAASDVIYLHRIKVKLDEMLIRENRIKLALECFKFLPTRAALDLAGWNELDIFAH